MRNLTLPACAAAALLGVCAGSASAAISPADRTFAEKAASGGMAEIQAAELAQQRASSPQVKQFAGRMITDHSKANDELAQIAQGQPAEAPGPQWQGF